MKEKKSSDKNWIQKINMNEGALTKTAKKEGGETKKGTIKKSFLDDAAEGEYGKKTAKRANLAKTLGKMRAK